MTKDTGKALVIHSKDFPVVSISKEDIITFFRAKYRRMPEFDERLKVIEKMTDRDMEELAKKMEREYVKSVFWFDLENIFEDEIMTK